MHRVSRLLLAVVLAISCSGDRAPRNDTTSVEEPPPDDPSRPTRAATWNAAAGALFAVRSATGAQTWIINPAFNNTQALDTLTAATWNAEGTTLTMLDGARVVGPGHVTAFHYDTTCAGWPTATLAAQTATSATWRLAFPERAVEGIAYDSLPDLSPADSAARARDGALAASRLPDDTVTAFRGRPFIVRQSSRFTAGADTLTFFEVVRLVAQEANPLQEQLLVLTEGDSARPVFHEREVGEEESMGSIELLGALRITSTGRLALLVRRERESGFILEWIERTARGTWIVRWRSAVDSC